MKLLISILFIISTLSIALSMPEIIRVSKYISHTGIELRKNQAAIEKLKEVVSGDCFKREMMSRKLIQTNSKTNAQVIESMLGASVEVKLSMYRDKSKVLGWTKPSSDTININRKYADNFGVCSIASNLSHEWSHKLGYKHDYRPNKKRPYSVPYSAGYLLTKCCKD